MAALSSSRLLFGALVLSLAVGGAAAAELRFPERPLRIVVTFTPGTAVDVVARTLASKLSESLDKPVVVENRDGGGGTIGTALAAAATADGHTMLVASTATVVGPLLMKDVPYDAYRDFASVASIVTLPTVLAVSAQFKPASVADLIDYARANPGRLNYASAGRGSVSHLGAELMRSMSGIDIVEVPYRNSGQALTDTISGQVTMFFANVALSLPSIKTGRLKALAVTSAKRTRAAPEIPAMAETLPGYEAANWYGVVVPVRTPAPIVAKLGAEFRKALTQPDVQQRFLGLGGDIAAGTPEDLDRTMKAGRQKWAKLVREIEAQHR
jgi:tripartite-type tricarboxylate transporter receptor subunit TctC